MCKEGINFSINCNSNCFQWCPRVLNVFCCRTKKEPEDLEQRVKEIVEQKMPHTQDLERFPEIEPRNAREVVILQGQRNDFLVEHFIEPLDR